MTLTSACAVASHRSPSPPSVLTRAFQPESLQVRGGYERGSMVTTPSSRPGGVGPPQIHRFCFSPTRREHSLAAERLPSDMRTRAPRTLNGDGGMGRDDRRPQRTIPCFVVKLIAVRVKLYMPASRSPALSDKLEVVFCPARRDPTRSVGTAFSFRRPRKTVRARRLLSSDPSTTRLSHESPPRAFESERWARVGS